MIIIIEFNNDDNVGKEEMVSFMLTSFGFNTDIGLRQSEFMYFDYSYNVSNNSATVLADM